MGTRKYKIGNDAGHSAYLRYRAELEMQGPYRGLDRLLQLQGLVQATAEILQLQGPVH